QGYGRVWVETERGRKKWLYHRVLFEQVYGYRPPVVMHACDNTRCIEPAHLVPGDWAKNNADRAAKGRSAKAVPSKRKLSRDDVEKIRALYTPKGSPGYSRATGVVAIARMFGVNTNVVYQIASGQTHREV